MANFQGEFKLPRKKPFNHYIDLEAEMWKKA